MKTVFRFSLKYKKLLHYQNILLKVRPVTFEVMVVSILLGK